MKKRPNHVLPSLPLLLQLGRDLFPFPPHLEMLCAAQSSLEK